MGVRSEMPMTSSSPGHAIRVRMRAALGRMLVSLLATGLIVGSLGAANPQTSRIVAVGDIHGRRDRLVSVMEQAGLIDEHGDWIGGRSTFVSVGDFMDRGPQVRAVMDLLIRLQKEAPKHHGEVVVLLGNHEMMNIIGDYRYVTPEIFASFADKDSETRRREAFETYRRTLARQEGILGAPPSGELGEEEWMQSHPPGFVEYTEAMGPKKTYGKWLRELPAVVKIGDTVFVHAGIHPGIRKYSIKDLNARIDAERAVYDQWKDYLVEHRVLAPFFTLDEALQAIRAYSDFYQAQAGTADTAGGEGNGSEQLVQVLGAFSSIGNWLSTHPDGPLWFRGFAKWSDEEGESSIGPLLESYQAKRFVVGHTEMSGGIVRRFDDRIVLIDTVRPSALEIEGGRLREIYVEGMQARPVEDRAEVPALP